MYLILTNKKSLALKHIYISTWYSIHLAHLSSSFFILSLPKIWCLVVEILIWWIRMSILSYISIVSLFCLAYSSIVLLILLDSYIDTILTRWNSKMYNTRFLLSFLSYELLYHRNDQEKYLTLNQVINIAYTQSEYKTSGYTMIMFYSFLRIFINTIQVLIHTHSFIYYLLKVIPFRWKYIRDG